MNKNYQRERVNFTQYNKRNSGLYRHRRSQATSTTNCLLSGLCSPTTVLQ